MNQLTNSNKPSCFCAFVVNLTIIFLFTIPSKLNAQTKQSDLLQLFKTKNNSTIFSNVESLKKARKEDILAKIAVLPEAGKKEIIRNADAMLNAPWSILTLTQFNEFKLNGNRVNYENNYFSRRHKLSTLIIGELVSKQGKYIPEIVNGLGLLCEETTWALPAHMSLQKSGDGLPDVNEPIIDLFVSHTAILLSYTKYLLGDQLDKYSPLLRKRLDFELNRRVFQPYLARNDFWWMGFETKKKMNNWNIFINTNVLATAMFAQDDAKVREAVIEKSVRSVDNFLRPYPADGGCDEGPSYWGMAGGILIEYLDLLSSFSDHQLDFSKSERIHNIGTYIVKVNIDGNYYVNFADAAAANVQDAGKIFKYGKLFNDKNLLEFAAYVRQINNGAELFDLSNIQAFVTSIELRNEFAKIKPIAPNLKRSWLPDVQILTARQNEGSAKGLYVAAKGGHNAESHNHNDIGNFILYKDGTPVVIDAGVGVYTKQTFSADRYRLWYMQSGWHNCPTINGVMQQAGGEFKASHVVFSTKNEITKLSMDLADGYPADADVAFWNRTISLNDKKEIVSLTEDYKLKTFKVPSTLNFLINGTVTAGEKGKLKLTNDQGKTIYLVYNPNDFEYQTETKKIDDARLAGSWHNDLTRLILKRKGSALSGKYTIEFKN